MPSKRIEKASKHTFHGYPVDISIEEVGKILDEMHDRISILEIYEETRKRTVKAV